MMKMKKIFGAKKPQHIYFRLTGDKLYKIPLSMNEVDINTGIQILNILDYKIPENVKYRRVISLMCNIEMSELSKVSDVMIEAIYPSIDNILKDCKLPIFNVIGGDKRHFGLVDVSELTVRQEMGIMSAMSRGSNCIEAGVLLMDTLYRPVKLNRSDAIKSKIFNKLPLLNLKAINIGVKYDITDIEEDLTAYYSENISSGYALALYSATVGIESALHKEFPDIFPTKESRRDNGLDEEEEKLKDNKTKSKVISVSESWGLYDTLCNICGDDKKLFDYWLNKPIREFYTYVSYRIQKSKEETNKHKI